MGILEDLYAKGPPTVASTGGTTPMMSPGLLALLASIQSSQNQQAPAGSVPNMGLGEQAAYAPSSSLFGVPGELGSGLAATGFPGVPQPPQSLQVPFPGAPYTRASQDVPLSDNSVLPSNATATVGGPVPGIMPSAAPSGPSGLDRLMGALSGNSNTLLALAGGLGGARTWGEGIGRGAQLAIPASQLDQRQQAQNLAVQALVRKGVPGNEAMAIATNPDILKQVLAQLYGPKTAPKIETIHGPGGQQSAYWDPVKQQYVDPITKQPVQVQNTGGPSNTPFAASPIPPNVDADAFRKAEATRLADAEKDLRAKGEGSLEFLPDAIRVQDKLLQPKSAAAIGPIVGSPAYNEYVRGYGGALDPTGTARENLGTYNQLQADLKRLSTSNLRAQFGARITNVEIGQNNQTFGGLQSADPATAHSILSERIRDSYENLGRNLDAGFIKPSAVPPAVAQKGVEAGLLDPKYFPGLERRAPTSSSSGGWTDLGGGIRIREKR